METLIKKLKNIIKPSSRDEFSAEFSEKYLKNKEYTESEKEFSDILEELRMRKKEVR